ncbi:uncharacterized protein F4822DRAFT_431812 [Hypoxylon trugodes]|uniref:uncharacterized protein n=1 Tax=Hypoxylon trugodes TaxID=326681 RepID=UPI00219692B0|nr:uncharacterized protein F4822DRAFT_431812 [Hypoxylon trugodes]KAI1386946.1 hypothetical protein F4822DRAFT_431812 [Hypoxylon trugodes]
MSSSAAFSYAQAAKGQSAAQSIPGSQSSTTGSKAPSTTSTQSRDVAPTPSTRAPSVAISTTSNELDGSQNTRSSSVKPEASQSNNNDIDSMSTSDKTTEALNLPNQNGEKVLSEVVPQSTERRGRGQTLNSQTTDAGDNKKTRKGRKGKAAEKESTQDEDQDKKENQPPKPLSEAPVPTVNIWTQRQEAMAAKAKVTPPASQLRAPNATNGSQSEGSSSQVQEMKQRTPQNDGVDATLAQSRPLPGGVRPPRKDAEQSRGTGNQNTRRTAPRGARANNGEDRPPFEALAPIATNTSSWPTPETAANDMKVQANPSKPEKEQKEDSAQNKPRQKKGWTPIDFVPTVNFETPLPARGLRGGRTPGARGGRDTAVRGNHTPNTPTDRTQENGSAPGSASMAPPSSKRAFVDTPISREGRKAQTPVGTGKVVGDAASASVKADKKEYPGDSANGVTAQHVPTRAAGSNHRVDDSTKSSSSQTVKENGVSATKDAVFQGQNNATRSERARGSTRGRGGHGSMNGIAHSQSQFGQGTSGYNYPSNANLRQPSHTYAAGYAQMSYGQYPVQTSGSQHRSRPSSGNNRSQGGARHQSSRSAYPMVGASYDPAMYPHGNGSPYPAYPDPNHILSGVLSQVEYYFSIDNLCKDWYLRKFMDSQGFVPLTVITTFKRMQEIAQDYQLVRMACDSSPLIEIIVTEDGQDKVRRAEQWEPWVLAKNERHPSAQNDGPAHYRQFTNPPAFWPQMVSYGGDMPPVYSPTGTEPNFAHHIHLNSISTTMNGVNGHVNPSESQLSATVPEFSPTGLPGMATASQQDTISSDTPSGDPNLENPLKKVAVPSFGEQANSLTNGFHKHNEQNGTTETLSVNGVGGDHGTNGY